MVELYRELDAPVDEEKLLHWHGLLMNGRRDLEAIGSYRTGGDPMQVVSGPLHEPRVHFEAPPSAAVLSEIHRFLEWYGRLGPRGEAPMTMLRARGCYAVLARRRI